MRASCDSLRVVVLSPRELTCIAAGQHLGEAGDIGERNAGLVRQGCHEFGFHAVGGDGRLGVRAQGTGKLHRNGHIDIAQENRAVGQGQMMGVKYRSVLAHEAAVACGPTEQLGNRPIAAVRLQKFA